MKLQRHFQTCRSDFARHRAATHYFTGGFRQDALTQNRTLSFVDYNNFTNDPDEESQSRCRKFAIAILDQLKEINIRNTRLDY